MAYNATYEIDDVDDIVIDGLGTFGASGVIWIGLIVLFIVLLLILGYIVGISNRLKKLIK